MNKRHLVDAGLPFLLIFHKSLSPELVLKILIWPVSCEKGPSDICKKCRPWPAAATPTQRLIRVYTFLHSLHQCHYDTYTSSRVINLTTNKSFQHDIGANLGLHYVKCQNVPFRVMLAIYHWYFTLKCRSFKTDVFFFKNPQFNGLTVYLLIRKVCL